MNTKSLRETIDEMILPDNIRFYEVDGQKIFPIGFSGYYTTVICYLVSQVELDYVAVQPIEFTMKRMFSEVTNLRAKLQIALLQFRQDLISGNTRKVSLDGGELGRESDKPINLLVG